MKELSHIIDILSTTTQPCVLASLVKVEGSSYRKVGARLLWSPGGPRAGAISGGCLEEDLVERARRVLSTGRADVVIYDTTEENDLVWGVGLGCHGIVRILLEPVTGLPDVLAEVRQAWVERRPAVVAQVYQEGGGRPLGAIPLASHPELGPLARTAVEEQRHVYARLEGAELFVEYLPPPPRLILFGAGDDAQPLARLAKEMGWRVVVTDPRSAYATRERFSSADEVRVLPPEELAALPSDAWTVAVVMTHHYRFDLPALKALLPRELRYLGLLGPKKRAERILEDLRRDGLTVTSAMRERLHAPVGLDLGGGTPEEVALSITAEIQSQFTGRDGRALRDRSQPIHA